MHNMLQTTFSWYDNNTIFTEICTAVLIKFFVAQRQLLFEDGAYLENCMWHRNSIILFNGLGISIWMKVVCVNILDKQRNYQKEFFVVIVVVAVAKQPEYQQSRQSLYPIGIQLWKNCLLFYATNHTSEFHLLCWKMLNLSPLKHFKKTNIERTYLIVYIGQHNFFMVGL